jgi:hypothetical protein
MSRRFNHPEPVPVPVSTGNSNSRGAPGPQGAKVVAERLQSPARLEDDLSLLARGLSLLVGLVRFSRRVRRRSTRSPRS